MKKNMIYSSLRPLTMVLAICLALASCQKYNPFDSYWHGGFEREETGGKPGKGGLFADGYGTEESPYGLATAQQMQNMARGLVEGEVIYFKMLKDIDLTGVSWTALNPTDPYKKFIDFNGDGNIIINLYVGKQAYGSFFGVLCGRCYDVGFFDAYAESGGGGGILGGYLGLRGPSSSEFTGQVERVYATGTVRAGGDGGGLFGDMGKTVDGTRCSISQCYAFVEVNGGTVGGLVGRMYAGGYIDRSYAKGDVLGTNATSGTNYAGGLVGVVDGGIVENCIAWNDNVTGQVAGAAYGSLTGGGTVSNCYYLSIMSGPGILNEGTTPKSKEDLQGIAAAWGDGWCDNGAIANGYPILNWQKERGDYGAYAGYGGGGGGGGEEYTPSFAGGTGTQADPYRIATLVHLRSMHDTLKAATETWFRLDADVDAKTLSNWVPLNTADPYDIQIHFDGNNHSISNLKSSGGIYPSFFGVLNGEVKNLTFKACKITQTENSPCGIVGGYAGSNGGLSATVTGVTTDEECKVTSSGNLQAGGFFGVACNTTFTNCTNKAEVRSTNHSNQDKDTGNFGCGGIAGKVNKPCTFTGCSNEGAIYGSRLTGGIAGLVGAQNCRFTGCSNSGSVTVTEITGSHGNGQRGGGIAAHVEEGTVITKCFNTGAVTSKSVSGGIVGYMENNSNTEVSQCYSTGSIGGNEQLGGIAGVCLGGEISNCWSGGTITLSAQIGGGIAGEVSGGYLSENYPAAKAKILNCWTKATIKGQRVLGGIAGRCAHVGWNATTEDAQKISDVTIQNCIVWCPSIESTDRRSPANEGSSGIVVGYTYIKNTLKNCYRKASINYTPTYTEAAIPATDQDVVDADHPLTTGIAPTYCYPWHGTKAGASATVTSLATSLGWDGNIWNLSGNEPSLK